MKKTVIFYLLCALTVFLFTFTLFRTTKVRKYISPVYNTMNVILNTETTAPTDVVININGKYSEIPKSKNIKDGINKTIKGKVETLEILVNDNFKNKINEIIIFNDIKPHYYKDFSKFEKEKTKLCPIDKCYTYTKYTPPSEIKSGKRQDVYNYKNHLNSIIAIILTLFSGHMIFLFSYILLFITIIYFINHKLEIKTLKINPIFITVLVFILGIISYSNNIFYSLPWTDEYRTIEYSNPNESLSVIFQDPGNPPLFYILFRCFIALFGVSQASMRIFPFLISILFLIILWLFLKNKFNLKTANIGVFLALINIPLIYYAQETRSYILQAFLTPILVYFLFKLLKENKKQDYIIYGIMAAIASNVHYYEILLLVSNYIFGIIYLSFEKKPKEILKFTLTNILGGLFFLPFFLKTAYNNALVNATFNDWIPDINYFQIKKCVLYLFGGTFSLILSAAFFIKNIFQKDKNTLLIYSFFAIVFTIALAVILSYLIRPMLVERYLILLSPLFIIFLCSVFEDKYKNKYMIILFIIWVLSIQANSFEKANRLKGMLEIPMSAARQYIEYKDSKENIYTILNLSNPEYLKEKDKIMNDKITYVSTSVNIANEEIEKILNKDKNAVIFTSIDLKNAKKEAPDYYTCYFNAAVDMCMWKIAK